MFETTRTKWTFPEDAENMRINIGNIVISIDESVSFLDENAPIKLKTKTYSDMDGDELYATTHLSPDDAVKYARILLAFAQYVRKFGEKRTVVEQMAECVVSCLVEIPMTVEDIEVMVKNWEMTAE